MKILPFNYEDYDISVEYIQSWSGKPRYVVGYVSPFSKHT